MQGTLYQLLRIIEELIRQPVKGDAGMRTTVDISVYMACHLDKNNSRFYTLTWRCHLQASGIGELIDTTNPELFHWFHPVCICI